MHFPVTQEVLVYPPLPSITFISTPFTIKELREDTVSRKDFIEPDKCYSNESSNNCYVVDFKLWKYEEF